MGYKLYLFILMAVVAYSGTQAQTILTAPTPMAGGLFGQQLAAEGGTIITIDNPGNNGSARKVYAFKLSGNTWVADGNLVNPDQVASDNYGSNVAVSGDYAVVGASGVSGEQGRAYVFKRTGAATWNLEATLSGSDIVNGDKFGIGVAISGTSLVVGANAKNNGVGAAYVFSLTNGTWQQVAKLVPTDSPNGRFGTWMSMYEDYIAVAAHQREKVFIYKKDGTNWPQQALLETPTEDNDFGVSCSIFKDRLVVGALNDGEAGQNAGAVYIYKRTGEAWQLEQKLLAQDAAAGKAFGGRNALSEHYAVIGSLYDVNDINGWKGAAYIFKRVGNTWTQMEKFTTPGYDYLAWYNAIDGNKAVVSAYGSDIDADNAGAIYVYDLPEVTSPVAEAKLMDLQLFPNPASDFVSVQFPAGLVPISMVLLNQSGSIVQQWDTAPTNIPIKHLPAGAYYLKVDFEGSKGQGVFQKF